MQVPVLRRNGDGRAVLRITEVEIDQLLVDLETGVFKAVDQAYNRKQIVDSAGAGAACCGAGAACCGAWP